MTTVPETVDRRFREAAAAEGLLDVAYDIVDSPLGGLLVAVSGRGVCRIAYDPEPEAALDELARRFGERVLRSTPAVETARSELDEYFAGRRRRFDLTVDLTPVGGFGRRVLTELAHVPYGEVTTYGTLAVRSGNPLAARAVGSVMNRNPIPIVLPCHRVIGAAGSLVGYAGGLERKQALLRHEGVAL